MLRGGRVAVATSDPFIDCSIYSPRELLQCPIWQLHALHGERLLLYAFTGDAEKKPSKGMGIYVTELDYQQEHSASRAFRRECVTKK